MKKKQITDVASKTLPPKEFQLQSSATAKEQFREKTGNEQVLYLDDSNSCPTDIQETKEHIVTTPKGDGTFSPLASTTPHIEENLMRDEPTNKMYLTLSSTVVVKSKQGMRYVLLDSNHNLTIDALVD